MLKIGFESLGLIREESMEADYAFLEELGVECIDLGLDAYLSKQAIKNGELEEFTSNWNAEGMCQKYKELGKKHNISYYQMHAPYPMENLELYSGKWVALMEECIDICEELSCRYLVVHMEMFPGFEQKEEERANNICFFSKLIPKLMTTNVVICFENLYKSFNGHLMEGICCETSEVRYYIDTLNELAGDEKFGFCLDVGHAKILGKNIYEMLISLGSHVRCVHIHDNDGMHDLHLMPYTFAAGWRPPTTDWDGFLHGLSKIGYEGAINFETARVTECFPEEVKADVLGLQIKLAKYFKSKIVK